MTLNGVRGAYAQPGRYGRTEAGAFADKVWEGTLNEIVSEALAVEFSGGLWTVTESYTGGKYRLEAHFPIDFNATETPVDAWELFGEEIEKDILQADIPEIDALEEPDIDALRSALDNGIDSKDPLQQTRLSDGFASDLYEQIRLGLKSKIISVEHLRHTQTVSSLWTVPHSRTNVGKIISTATLIADEKPPSVLGLPTDVSTRRNMEYGWYKKKATVRTCAGHKTQIEQEWEYGLWSTLIYNSPL